MAQLPLLKLGGLLVKTIAKPVASRMKVEAKKHPNFMTACIAIGQFSHQITSRLNILASGYKILGVKPLPEEDALSRGVNFLSESFVFLVGGTIIVVEYSRSEAKSAIKAEQQAQKEADFLARLAAIEEKLANVNTSESSSISNNQIVDLNRRLKSVEKVASYWAMNEVNIASKHAPPAIAIDLAEDVLPLHTAPEQTAPVLTTSHSSPVVVLPTQEYNSNTWLLSWLDLSWIWGAQKGNS